MSQPVVRMHSRDQATLEKLCAGEIPQKVLDLYGEWQYAYNTREGASGAMPDAYLFILCMQAGAMKRPPLEPSAFDNLDPNQKHYVYVINTNAPPGQQVIMEGVYKGRESGGMVIVDEWDSGYEQFYNQSMVRIAHEKPKWALAKEAEEEKRSRAETSQVLQDNSDQNMEKREQLRQKFLAHPVGQQWCRMLRGTTLSHILTAEPAVFLSFNTDDCFAEVLWPRRAADKRVERVPFTNFDVDTDQKLNRYTDEQIEALLNPHDKTKHPWFGREFGTRIVGMQVVGRPDKGRGKDARGWFLRMDKDPRKIWIRISSGPRDMRDRCVDIARVELLNGEVEVDAASCEAAGPILDPKLEHQAG